MNQPKILTEGQVLALEIAASRKSAAVRKWIVRELLFLIFLGLLAWWQFLTADWFLQAGEKSFWKTQQTLIWSVAVLTVAVLLAAHVAFYRWVFKTA